MTSFYSKIDGTVDFGHGPMTGQEIMGRHVIPGTETGRLLYETFVQSPDISDFLANSLGLLSRDYQQD